MLAPLAVANAFVRIASRSGCVDLTAAKLHHMIYFAHGWSLGAEARPLISQPLQADRDGVFVPALRDAGCTGTRRVEQPIEVFGLDGDRGVMISYVPDIPAEHPCHLVVEHVWARFGSLTPFQLAAFVREVGSPWDLIWNDEDRRDHVARNIPNGTLKLWFLNFVVEEDARAARERNLALGDTQAMLERPNPDRLRTA